ncbi:MAG TPA: hypothetical protein VK021_03210 [Flavobacteriaceae bacterium]|nr:hypothetical protein [Flavobacteriaceae bacterium]
MSLQNHNKKSNKYSALNIGTKTKTIKNTLGIILIIIFLSTFFMGNYNPLFYLLIVPALFGLHLIFEQMKIKEVI